MLIASAVPSPSIPGTSPNKADYYSPTAVPPTSLGLTSGNYAALSSSKINENSAAADISTRYTGGYGVVRGLVVSAGTGLTVNVTAGQALMDGIVETTATTVVNVNPSSPREYVWLKQDGTFIVQHNTLAAPAGNAVFIGSCVTDGSGVTSVDATGGVVYIKNGMLWRQTGDTTYPTDTPSSTVRMLTQTLSGLYFWDGSNWHFIPSRLCVNQATIPTGASDYIDVTGQVSIMDSFTVNGTLTIDGKFKVA